MSLTPALLSTLRRSAVATSRALVPPAVELLQRYLHRTGSGIDSLSNVQHHHNPAPTPFNTCSEHGLATAAGDVATNFDSSAAAAVAAAAMVVAEGATLRAVGGVDFNMKAVTVDAAGTLLEPTEAVADVYLRIGEKYGVEKSKAEILARYRQAFAAPFYNSRLRYEADGREYWSHVATESTGCNHPGFLQELHEYYSDKQAWRLTDENAGYAFEAMRRAGLKLAVVSNFDTRLRSILDQLNCLEWFDALAVSAEVEAEKPNPVIFWHACDKLQVKPEQTVHIGDDRRNDVWGARDAGCHAWLWQGDVSSFQEVAELVGVRVNH